MSLKSKVKWYCGFGELGHPYHSKVLAVVCYCPPWLNNTLQVHLKHPFYSSVFPFISLFYGSVQMNNCGLMLPAIASYAARRTDQRGPSWLGGRYNKAGLDMHSERRTAKMLGVCWDSRWLALLSLPLAQPRQDRLNCLISKRASKDSASSTLFNVKSAMERKG